MDFARHAKSWVKLATANLLYWTGALSLLVRRRLKGRAIVLMYHRVLPADLARRSFSHPGIVVTPETFARHMDFLKRKFLPLSLEEFMAAHGIQAALSPMVHAWSHSTTAGSTTMSTRCRSCASREFPQSCSSPRITSSPTAHSGRSALGICCMRHRVAAWANLILACIRLSRLAGVTIPRFDRPSLLRSTDFRVESYDAIEALTHALEHALAKATPPGAVQPPDRFMNWEQLRSLAQNRVTIASHTRSHRVLPRLEASVVKVELAESRRILADKIGGDIAAFAYPGGFHDDRARQTAIDCGYRMAFTTDASVAEVDKRSLAHSTGQHSRIRGADSSLVPVPDGRAAVTSRRVHQAMKILVTDADNRASLAVTRSLGRKGHEVYVAHHRHPALASSSRFCRQRVLVTDPLKSPDAFVEDTIAAVKAESHRCGDSGI
jgi:hypothetical protein